MGEGLGMQAAEGGSDSGMCHRPGPDPHHLPAVQTGTSEWIYVCLDMTPLPTKTRFDHMRLS